MSRDIEKLLLEWEENKSKVLKRDRFRCTRCGADNIQLYVQHIISLSEGGTNDLKNLVTLCENCYERQHGPSETNEKILAQVLSLPYYRCPSCKRESTTLLGGHYCLKCGRHITEKNLVLRPIEPKKAKKGCFIATAAYGTEFGKELDYFRTFRDTFLLRNLVGRVFVSYYYRISPFFSKIIAKSNRRRYVVRLILNRIYQIKILD